ncbi:type II secretion system protein GspL [Massilia sp. TS11]|uniref:type II secretion system protein GspL n=1 Tax=Massilia sp. TS11 TaxID=2908003 RepID=UPI001EDB45C4|nr:type II secretion system protein GspL [Massilia sp. TS11]MCG2585861.1 type II secretion system protein GspL [Massilia sp. TS11]
MTTLYLRHPARALGSQASCQYALASDQGGLLQQGLLGLAALAELVAGARRVVLILAAADVTLVRLPVPPLAGARLKAALPNLVEDHVLGDPAECVLAASAADAEGRRTIAVAERAWVAELAQRLLAQGARQLRIVPAPLCLPPGTAAIHQGDLAVRLNADEGAGLVLEAEAGAVLAAASALGAERLLVPAPERAAYAGAEIAVEADAWPVWIAGAASAPIDLAPALGAAGAAQIDWKRYRWPAALAVLALLVNALALNLEWLRLKREADAVRQSMFQTYKAAYPNAPEPLYPAEQLRRAVLSARAGSGQLAPTDFIWQSAAIGEALNAANPKPAVLALNFNDNVLTVKLRPDSLRPGVLEQVRGALGARGLIVSETQPGLWQLRVKEGK